MGAGLVKNVRNQCALKLTFSLERRRASKKRRKNVARLYFSLLFARADGNGGGGGRGWSA